MTTWFEVRPIRPEQLNECTYDVVVCRVDFLEETGGTPATSEDDQSLLCRIVWKLESRSTFLMSDIIETSPSKDHGANGESADRLESPSPSRNTNDLTRQMYQK